MNHWQRSRLSLFQSFLNTCICSWSVFQFPFFKFADMTITTTKKNYVLLCLDVATKWVEGTQASSAFSNRMRKPTSTACFITLYVNNWMHVVILWDNPCFQNVYGILRLLSANFAYCDFNIDMIPCYYLIFMDNQKILLEFGFFGQCGGHCKA